MSLLQLLISIVGFIFLLFAIDARQRGKLNLLHFLVFFGGAGCIVYFVLQPQRLNEFGQFFGVARGADLIVYMSIVLLGYLYFDLIASDIKTGQSLTRLISQLSYKDFSPEAYRQKATLQDTVFFIRAYNEAHTIAWVVREIQDFWYTNILIVNDGSKDDSKDIIQWLQKSWNGEGIILISHDINRWWWAANKTWFEFLRRFGKKIGWRYVVCFDADGQMDIQDMPQMLQALQHNSSLDLVLGSRFVEGGKATQMPLHRKIILRGGKFITRLFNGIYVSDPHNGYRMRTIDAISKIQLTADGFMYANELNEEIRRNNLKFIELPVHIRYTDYSLGKGQKSSNAFKILWWLIYKKFFYR